MPERTHQPPQPPTPAPLAPQPSRVLTEPATVQACRADYADGADIRQRLGWKDPA